MKLFMVTDGDYSDYRVLGIYSTKELADHAKEVFDADNEHQEIEVDALPPHPPGLFAWRVDMDNSGSVDWASRVKPREDLESIDPLGSKSCYGRFHMWAKDEQHAIKIANERRIQLLATNQWETDWEEWRARRK